MIEVFLYFGFLGMIVYGIWGIRRGIRKRIDNIKDRPGGWEN